MNLVTVVITIYNQAEFLLEAVQSVNNQSWEELELLIVDDGSTDKISDVISSIHIPHNYIRQENNGPAAARNRGVQCSRGSFVAFLDADDIWTEDRLEMLMKYSMQGNDVVIGKSKSEKEEAWLPLFGASLIRKSAFDQIGLLNEELRYSEDQDWFLRAKESKLNILAIDDVVLLRRIHAESLTFNKSWKDLEIHKVLKLSLDRRRAMQNDLRLQTLSSYGTSYDC